MVKDKIRLHLLQSTKSKEALLLIWSVVQLHTCTP